MGSNVTVVGRLRKDEKKKELKKHAATIHCSNTLSLLQRKISNALLYHAYEELKQKEEHEITIKQLCRLIGYQGNNHAAIKDALRGLITTLIEWNLIDGSGVENWTASSILASVSLEGPLCFYAYSPRMKQLLHSPSMFGKIDLVIQSHFRSSYGLALYENCIRYRGLPNTKWIEMVLFKKLMGVPAGKYDVFRDFKRRVLDKAIDEVNTYSDLIITPEYQREGRKVIRLRFKLKERAKRIRLGLQPESITHQDAITSLKLKLSQEFHLSVAQVEEVLHEYDHSFIETKLRLIESSNPYRDGKINNLAAYLLSALKNDYQLSKLTSVVTTLAATNQATEKLKAQRKIIEDAKERYHTYRETMIEQRILEMPLDKKDRFLKEFSHFAASAIHTVLHVQASRYTRETVYNSPQIKGLLRQYALQHLDFSNLITFEEYLLQEPETVREAWENLQNENSEKLKPITEF